MYDITLSLYNILYININAMIQRLIRSNRYIYSGRNTILSLLTMENLVWGDTIFSLTTKGEFDTISY